MFEPQRDSIVASLDARQFVVARVDLDSLISNITTQTLVGSPDSRTLWTASLVMLEHIRDVHLPLVLDDGQEDAVRFLLFDLDII